MQENVSSVDKKRTDRHQTSPQICHHLGRITTILPADGPKMSQEPLSRKGRQIQRKIDTNAVMPKVTGSKKAATMTSDKPTAVRATGKKVSRKNTRQQSENPKKCTVHLVVGKLTHPNKPRCCACCLRCCCPSRHC